MTLYDRVACLPLTVDGHRLQRHEGETTSGFTRATTVFTLAGDGLEGRGEDVTYDTAEHDAIRDIEIDVPTVTDGTFDDFHRALDDVDLFPAGPPDRTVFRHYRRWGVESAALDLALRQADTHLAAVVDRTYDPVRFVVSRSLGEEPTATPIHRLLEYDADLEFKLDPIDAWTPALADDLAATDAVRILDLKGLYEGVDVAQGADVDLYELVTETFPEAIIEDPAVTPDTRPILDREVGRLSWDAPITDVASIADRPWSPAWINVKPSRFGSVASLLAAIEYCLEHDITMYGGGQFELDVGRQHLQALASVWYPDSPNDVAPRGYNEPGEAAERAASPLAPPTDPLGLTWTSPDGEA